MTHTRGIAPAILFHRLIEKRLILWADNCKCVKWQKCRTLFLSVKSQKQNLQACDLACVTNSTFVSCGLPLCGLQWMNSWKISQVCSVYLLNFNFKFQPSASNTVMTKSRSTNNFLWMHPANNAFPVTLDRVPPTRVTRDRQLKWYFFNKLWNNIFILWLLLRCHETMSSFLRDTDSYKTEGNGRS